MPIDRKLAMPVSLSGILIDRRTGILSPASAISRFHLITAGCRVESVFSYAGRDPPLEFVEVVPLRLRKEDNALSKGRSGSICIWPALGTGFRVAGARQDRGVLENGERAL
jgi:hypothetical protein